MNQEDRYVDLRGREVSLARLDADERLLLDTLKRRADRAPPWHEFANFWMKLVGEFYQGRGLSRSQVGTRSSTVSPRTSAAASRSGRASHGTRITATRLRSLFAPA